jgi:ElaB/YqjD/DUF883 family membrane-anchored ribosome-binding protein
MKRALLILAGVASIGTLGCKKKAEGNPRCQIFEQDPARVSDRGTLEEMRAAWEDVERIRECAQAAARTISEFRTEHRVDERLELAGRKLQELGVTLQQVGEQVGEQASTTGQAVLGEARQTVERAREGAEQAMDEAQRRIEEGIQAATGE